MTRGQDAKGCLMFIAVFFVLAFVGSLVREAYLSITEPFYYTFKQYAHIVARKKVDEPYIRGKIVAVNISKGEKPWYFGKVEEALPPDLRARTPAELGTAILIEEQYGPLCVAIIPSVGPMTFSRNYDCTCDDISIVDVSIRAVIDKKHFCEEQSPSTTTGSAAAGPDSKKVAAPAEQVLEYLLSLPRV